RLARRGPRPRLRGRRPHPFRRKDVPHRYRQRIGVVSAEFGMSDSQHSALRKLEATMRDDLARLNDAQNSVRSAAPYDVARPHTIPHSMVTTAFSLDNYRV